MNNFVQEGSILEVTAPYEVSGGDGLLRGNLFGIATSWARAGENVAINTAGVFDLTRAPGDEWQVGEPIYWHDERKCFTHDADGAVKVGVAVASTHGTGHPWVRGKLIGFALA